MLGLLSRKTARAQQTIRQIDKDKLPAFDSPAGQTLRRAIKDTPDAAALHDLQTAAEARWRTDWLALLDAELCRRYPGDISLLCRWITHEIAQRKDRSAKALTIILDSLSPDPDDVNVRSVRARLAYAAGALGEGDAHLERISEIVPEYDPKWLLAERCNCLISLEKWGDLEKCLQKILMTNPGDAGVTAMAIRAYAGYGAFGKILSLVERSGGPGAIGDEYVAFLYLTALDLDGQKSTCLREGVAILERHPDFFSLHFLMRSVAQSLDKLETMRPIFDAAAQTHPGHPMVLEILALSALDRDDFDEVERLMSSFSDKTCEPFLRFNLTYQTTRPGATGAESAYLAYRATDPAHAGPEIQYAGYLFGTATDLAAIETAHDILASQLERGRSNISFLRMYLQTLIALERMDAAEALLETLPAPQKSAKPIHEIALFFAQRAGDHETASQAWSTLAESGAYRAVTNASDLPERVTFNYDPVRDQVLAFACVFNAIEFAPWFLDYYRDLGVDHFLIVDNGSDDGTFEAFEREADVSLFSQPGSFKDSAHGVYWINHLMRTYGQDKWCFFVDMDEAFVFPGMEAGRTLHDLLRYCDAGGYAAMPSFMLDMFASHDGGSDFSANNCFDNSYLSFPAIRPPYRTIQGGFRSRLTERHFLITKSPLVKVRPDFYYLENNHTHTHLPTADLTTALLHYKFVGNAQARFDEAVARQQHFMGARFYKDLKRASGGNTFDRAGCTLDYTGPEQLCELGLISSSAAWETFK